MPFLELTIRCRQAEQPRREHALDDVGVTSRSESQRDSGWTVVDAFDVLFHVFRDDIRKSYALEALWKDGLDIPVSAILKA